MNARSGRPGEPLHRRDVPYPLETQVVDRHDGADAAVEGIVPEHLVQEDGNQPRLPVVAVDDVGTEAHGRQDRKGRLGEEAELFDVPQQIAVGLVAAEVVLVVDEVVGDALHPAGHDAHVDAAQAAQLHLKAVHVLELAAVFFGDAGIVGQDDAHVVTAFVERLGQRAGHVGQSTRLDERHAFRCDKQDVLHVISSSHVKGARRFFFPVYYNWRER